MAMSASDMLGRPRPIAWGYLAPPVYYDHAVPQWRAQLEEIATREGFTVEHWWIDTGGSSLGSGLSLYAMWHRLPGSGVKALFMPDPSHLQRLSIFDGLPVAVIRDRLPCQLFLLREDGFAPIVPPEPLANITTIIEPPPHPRRRWSRRRTP